MVTEQLLSDDVLSTESTPSASLSNHSRDSSRLLLGLTSFAHIGGSASQPKGASDTPGEAIAIPALRSLISALHFRDVATVCHSRRVAMVAVGMAQYLGWDQCQQKVLEISALLHDVGKIGVPDSILFKPGKLNPEESELMSLHRNIGIDVLQACRVHSDVLGIMALSHSNHSGKTNVGHQGNSTIHQGARILAVADAYDSLRTQQMYCDSKSHEETMQILMESAGTQFDGNIVSALARWIASESVPFAKKLAELSHDNSSTGPTQPEEALEASSLGHIFSYLYVLESLYDGFYIVDSNMNFSVWNLGLEKLLGQDAASTIGNPWSLQLFGYSDKRGNQLAEFDCPLNRVIAEGKPITSTVNIKRDDGRDIQVELQTVPLRDQDGTLHGVAEIFRDLSRSSRRKSEYRELKRAASRDPLTSAANRAELEAHLTQLLEEFGEGEESKTFCAIFLDVDHFKSINDTHGHTVGDQVLIELARLLQHETYSGELVARYGSEEFVLLCPATNIDQAVRRSERLRNAIAKKAFRGVTDRSVTASFGVTEVEPGDSVTGLLHRADQALYQSKQAGRNQTSSLTSQESQQQKDESDELTATRESTPFVFTGTFHACIAADMIVYKLAGFVNDYGAILVDATANKAVLRIGRIGMWPFCHWGSTDETQPVEIIMEFDSPETEFRSSRASRTAEVTVRIRPRGRIRDAEIFHERANSLLTELRAFFVAS